MKRVLIGFLLVLFISLGLSFFNKAKANEYVSNKDIVLSINCDMLVDNATNKISFLRKNMKQIIKR